MWDFGIKDLIDILVVGIGMFWLYRGAKKSGLLPIVQSVMIIIIIWVLVSFILRMRLLGSLLDNLISVGLIALVVLFQNEIRQGLMSIGSKYHLESVRRMFNATAESKTVSSDVVWLTEIVRACKAMADNRVGALICIQQTNSLELLGDTGQRLDAMVSARLVEQIFYKNTPLHDGAMLVANGRITKAACVLPLSQNPSIPQEFGTRHRAAMGLSELTDAKIIVVSEETGTITLVRNGKYYRYLNSDSLMTKLLDK